MASVLVLFAHPAYQRSRINRLLIESISDLDGVTIHDLYEACPDLMIDVAKEQELLSRHDVIVFQHPLFWYSSPALLKEWQDLVLTHGWAYGSTGTALAGKIALQCITVGGARQAYSIDGFNRYTIRQLLAPFDQTWRLCGVTWLGPFAVHGTHQLDVQEEGRKHAHDYRRLLEALRDEKLDLEAAQKVDLLNDDLNALLKASNETA